MDVVEVTGFGGPDVLRLAHRPVPAAGPGQVLVRVRAANVNPTDLAARAGYGPIAMPEPPFVPGWDFAGEVQAVAAGVTGFAPGDRVAGMIHWYDQKGTAGSYAEVVAVDASLLVRVPDALTYVAAATIPLNALTAAQGLDLLGLKPPARVLVTGASGAVGSFAVQLAADAGHWVTAVASDDDEEWVRSLGALKVLGRHADLTDSGPLATVFDAVPLGEPALAVVADGGALVTTRPLPPAVDGLARRQNVHARTLLVHQDRDRLQALMDAAARGLLQTRVDRTLPLAEAATAHRPTKSLSPGGIA